MKYSGPKNEDFYFNGYTRLAMAIVVSVVLIAYSTTTPFKEIIFSRRFYFAFAFNLLLASVVIELSYGMNWLLDRFFDWKRYGKIRALLQLIFGVMAVVYIDVRLVEGVYHILEQDFSKSGFMEKVLPLNILFVLLLQLLFYHRRYHSEWFSFRKWLAWGFKGAPRPGTASLGNKLMAYHIATGNLAPRRLLKKRLQLPIKLVAPVIDKPIYWKVVHGFIQSTKYVFILDEVLCISTGAVYGDIFLKSGKAYNMHYKGRVLRDNLDPEQFIEIRAGVFYALDAAKGVEKSDRSRKLILKPQYKHLEVNRNISRRYFAHVSTFFQNGEE